MAETVIPIIIPTSSELNTAQAEHVAEILVGLARVVVPDLIPAPNSLSGSVENGVIIHGDSNE